MSKHDYSFSYDYSNRSPLYKFINESTDALIEIFRDQYSYTLVQKDKKGQQRLKLNDNSLQSMLNSLDKNGWKELACR